MIALANGDLMSLHDWAQVLLAIGGAVLMILVTLLGWFGKRALDSVEKLAEGAMAKATEASQVLAVNGERVAEARIRMAEHEKLDAAMHEEVIGLRSMVMEHESAVKVLAERVGQALGMLEEVRNDVKALRERR